MESEEQTGIKEQQVSLEGLTGEALLGRPVPHYDREIRDELRTIRKLLEAQVGITSGD